MEDKRPVRIAFGHQDRVGKDTAAEYLSLVYDGHHLAFARKLYQVCHTVQQILRKPSEKDRKLLRGIGELFKDVYGKSVWADILEKEIKDIPKHESIFISDLRFPEEYDMLSKHGFQLVKIVRENRAVSDPTHVSETALVDHSFHHTVENNGEKEDFYKKLDLLVDSCRNIAQ